MIKGLTGLIYILITFSAQASIWKFDKKVDSFSDESVYTAKLVKDDSYAIVKCNNDELNIYFSVGEYIGGDWSKVRYRFDKGDVHAAKWGLSTTGKAVFSNASDYLNITKGFMSSQEMLLEVTKYTGTKFQKTFTTDGAKYAISQVLKACPIIDNSISQSEYYEMTKGIPEHIVKRHSIDRGPKNVLCSKRMLSHIGYKLKDMSPRWTREYFLKMKEMSQKYSDSSPYSMASDSEPAFKKECGYLRFDE
jgi:hypothetical protein